MPIDYSRYPRNWKREIVPAVRSRAGERCEGDALTGYDGPGERCNAPNGAVIVRERSKPGEWRLFEETEYATQCSGEPEPGVTVCKVVLTVAHLDHDPENHAVKLDRLRALCQRCHLNYDKERHRRKRSISRDANRGQALMFEPEEMTE